MNAHAKLSSTLPYTSKLDTIEIILKITARCNLDCTYCYYFNGVNQSALELPAVLSKANIKDIAAFVKQGVEELGIKYVTFDFHGGEPLMMNKNRFDWMCEHFTSELAEVTNLGFALQTNAVNVDDEWIDLFSKHQISIGVSLDGPKEYNDMYRIDLQGESSYQKTRDGIEKLNKAWLEDRFPGLGALCVINPEFKAHKIYQHLTQTLGFKGVDFLLPDLTHDEYEDHPGYGEFMRDMFNAWVEFGYDKFKVRRLNSLLQRLSGETRQFFSSFSEEEASMIAFSIQTDGTLGPDDTLFSNPMWDRIDNVHVSDTTLREFLSHPEMARLDSESRSTPEDCKECCWLNICGGGGMLAHQYSGKTDSSMHPSVHCGSLKELYSEATSFLLDNGMDPERLKSVLFTEDEINAAEPEIAT